MTEKHWYESRTLWFNAGFFTLTWLAALAGALGDAGFAAGWFVTLKSVIDVVLRFVTKLPIRSVI
jgi:hypothetical protein